MPILYRYLPKFGLEKTGFRTYLPHVTVTVTRNVTVKSKKTLEAAPRSTKL